jgi:hypothetical protein
LVAVVQAVVNPTHQVVLVELVVVLVAPCLLAE